MSAPAYWPWWLGALALGSVTTGVALFSGRTLGASGSLAKLAHPSAELEAEAMNSALPDDPAAFEAALLAATEAEFGAENSLADAPTPAEPPAPSAADESPAPPAPAVPLAGHLLFLLMVAVGALGASLARGHQGPHLSPGPAYDRFFGGGLRTLGALLVGGLLVGAGTRMAGGCTSGHGLSGCSRLVPSSLAATGAFFGTAVAVSLGLSFWSAR